MHACVEGGPIQGPISLMAWRHRKVHVSEHISIADKHSSHVSLILERQRHQTRKCGSTAHEKLLHPCRQKIDIAPAIQQPN